MSRRWVGTWLFFSGPVLASDDISRLEASLDALLVNAGYAEAFYSSLDRAYRNLPKPNLTDEASASARVQPVLAKYADRTVRLQFVDVASPHAMTAQVYGNRIVVNTLWVVEAADDDLHAVMAHEVAHDANDCIRFWLIEESRLTKRRKEKARQEIEMNADARAIDLLRREKRDATVLPDMLSRDLPPSPESKARIAAARKASRNQDGPSSRSRLHRAGNQ